MLDISKLVLYLGGALGALSLLAGAWFYVHHLQSEVTKYKTQYSEAASANKNNQKIILDLLANKAFDEKLLSDLSNKKQVIRREADERKAKVARQPDGATPPAVVCAITGVC